ncbi:5-(carboxyamino)imidazole ribonucleotide synthase [Janthinobacterium sp. GW458P]|uniref:5-(carboxyamino)imidazole ribonucleotide synthase n=1 Tax=Janthinobacterium sp. GW458P TaxID=1981504 RepID=UPI000A3275BF|nr:5-(carboxyamino)imidazole ribonucleotide synthase [Janthinobacterium sp. GW458P]MBE3024015.1 5-(carboxyamino)imidazole ribonucleotide synthase [Janthinobacterium sp. GW458P]
MNSKSTSPLLPAANPPAWLGVMGGGQLGRMFAQAAQSMGYQVAVLEPSDACPAGQVAQRLVHAGYGDLDGLDALAAQCLAVTTEFENVPADSLSRLAERVFVAPNAHGVSVAQDRIAEKRFFVDCAPKSGVLPAPHMVIATQLDIDGIADDLLPGILKTVRMGYDGKGQYRVRTRDEVRAAFAEMGEVTCLLEKMLPLAYEVSVLTARGVDGASVVYPIAENVHRDGVLFTTTVPGPNVSDDCAARAQRAAQAMVAELGYVGVLCIEFFVLEDGSLVVNEMAPRPHNSGHYTMDACVTSQFAQQVRAMARLPLGEVHQHSPAVMLNILGDAWFDSDETDTPREPAWDRILALPGACLHLYGKDEPRRGRKMGHLTFIAATLQEAQQRLRDACLILGIAP